MDKFTEHSGTAAVIGLANIDTDQIIPKQFLKRIERSGYGQFLFYDWRFAADGSPITGFVLNDPAYSKASILIAGENFGCGSSREHAPWSLLDHGFRVIIAPSFADIFYNNSLKTGLLPVMLPAEQSEYLAGRVLEDAGYAIKVDLDQQSVAASGFEGRFDIDPFRKYCLLNGLDDIGLTLTHEKAIGKFEQKRGADMSFLSL